jgi:hypothetical protein
VASFQTTFSSLYNRLHWFNKDPVRPKKAITRAERKLLVEMGVTREVMGTIEGASNNTDGEQALANAKAICRKGFRSAALECHPDHNQHLPEKEIKKKSERFKRMKSAHDKFLESRYQGQQGTNTRRAAADFDPFGFYPNVDDELRYWDDPLMRNFMRMKRQEQKRRARDPVDILEEMRKRAHWKKLGLDYDEMKRREEAKPKEKVVKLPDGKGIWYPERGRWILQTKRPKKS